MKHQNVSVRAKVQQNDIRRDIRHGTSLDMCHFHLFLLYIYIFTYCRPTGRVHAWPTLPEQEWARSTLNPFPAQPPNTTQHYPRHPYIPVLHFTYQPQEIRTPRMPRPAYITCTIKRLTGTGFKPSLSETELLLTYIEYLERALSDAKRHAELSRDEQRIGKGAR